MSSTTSEESPPDEQYAAIAAIVLVPRAVEQNQGNVTNIIARPLPGDCRDEEREFLREFQARVVQLVRELRPLYPYRHMIRWSIEYGDNRQFDLHITANARRH